MLQNVGDMNLALVFGAIGSGFGAGVAGMAAVGAWKKCYAQNRAAPLLLIAFVGAPLTQTLYGFVLSDKIRALGAAPDMTAYVTRILMGMMAGIALGISAYWQGKAAASACDAFAESNKGFANNMIILGIIETVALFVLAFSMMSVGKIA
jgi:V/A-type H+-transporting ATPase subunit K